MSNTIEKLFSADEILKFRADIEKVKYLKDRGSYEEIMTFIDTLISDRILDVVEKRIVKKHFQLTEQQFAEIINLHWDDDSPERVEKIICQISSETF